MNATRLRRMLDELGRISDERGRLTRTFLSPAMRRANARVGEWMRAAGLEVREDATGNIIGRFEGAARDRRTFVLGSHLDTVRDAGRFDGALGVLLPIVALAELRRRGVALPFAVEVVGFSEEEGVRFGSAFVGSKGYLGQLRRADLDRCDSDGISVREALRRFHGGRFREAKAARRPKEWLGYLEVHIEQGPVLERENRAVGVVSAIAGQTRLRVTIEGEAGHAGTTPMDLRRDALAAAANYVLCVEAFARQHPPLVATVGKLHVEPGAANVIPARAVLSVDVRHPDDAARREALQIFGRIAHQLARERKVTIRSETLQENAAAACAPALTALLAESVRAVQRRSVSLVSGAGHDAQVIAAVAPVALLFVRCRGGLSHHPDEFASTADLGVALEVTIDFLQRLAARNGS